jgi:hypothetical protein
VSHLEALLTAAGVFAGAAAGLVRFIVLPIWRAGRRLSAWSGRLVEVIDESDSTLTELARTVTETTEITGRLDAMELSLRRLEAGMAMHAAAHERLAAELRAKGISWSERPDG